MPGPTPMALGPVAFEALGFGFTDLTRDLDTPWSELDVAARFDAAHWTGPKTDAVTIKGVIFPHEWGGLSSLERLRGLASGGVLVPLVSSGGRIHGRYRIEGISEDRSAHTADGTPRRDAYQIKLKRYLGSAPGGLFGGIGAAVTGLF